MLSDQPATFASQVHSSLSQAITISQTEDSMRSPVSPQIADKLPVYLPVRCRLHTYFCLRYEARNTPRS
jgi:hypothetical protein